MALEMLCLLVHFGERLHKFDCFLQLAANSLTKKPRPVDHHMHSILELIPFPEVKLEVHNLKGLASGGSEQKKFLTSLSFLLDKSADQKLWETGQSDNQESHVMKPSC
jgi:hypothetical protein